MGFQPGATASSSFINTSNISNVVKFLPNKVHDISYALWHKYCCYMKIKSLTFGAHNLYKYIWEIIAYMILTNKRHLGPDIWPKTFKQAKSIESMMRILWSTEAIHQRAKASRISDWLLSCTSKKAKHMHEILFCDWYQQNH